MVVRVAFVLSARARPAFVCTPKLYLDGLDVKGYTAAMTKETPKIPDLSNYFRAMGKKGGKARMAQLTPEQRKRLARKAVRAREEAKVRKEAK